MDNFVLIDGNSIMNRAFYGIMGSKMLTTKDGKYTNAVYGFLAILFKLIEDTNPKYMAVAFDLKAPTARHKLYEGYKANRKGMPEELAEQMPLIKEILRAMHIDIVEKEGYEADDVLGTLSRYGEKQGLHVTILSGDRDTFQLATDNVTIRIPRTKGGKTETDLFDRNKIIETYGIEPKQLIEVKGLQGDSSDNIPGVPGIGEKTALSLIQKYGSIDNLYDKIEKDEDDLKGKQREKIKDNKELAELSKTLGTINLEVPIEDTLEQFKVEEWDKEKVLKLFKELNFNRYIERFHLTGEKNDSQEENYKIEFKMVEKSIEEVIDIVKTQKNMTFYLQTDADESPENIIKEKITGMSLYNTQTQEAYYIKLEQEEIVKLKEILEDAEIKKTSINLTKVYILLKQADITLDGIENDISIGAYILNPTNNKLDLKNLAMQYLELERTVARVLYGRMLPYDRRDRNRSERAQSDDFRYYGCSARFRNRFGRGSACNLGGYARLRRRPIAERKSRRTVSAVRFVGTRRQRGESRSVLRLRRRNAFARAGERQRVRAATGRQVLDRVYGKKHRRYDGGKSVARNGGRRGNAFVCA